MKKIIFAVVSVFTMAAFASGGSSPSPFICYFTVAPKVNPNQDDGPYTGRGNTPTEAKEAALKACHEDLDFWVEKACDNFYQNTANMECTVNAQ